MQRDLEIAIQLQVILIYSNSPSHNFAVEKVKPRSMKPVRKGVDVRLKYLISGRGVNGAGMGTISQLNTDGRDAKSSKD